MKKYLDSNVFDAGFAQGFLESTRDYLANESATAQATVVEANAMHAAPLPIVERGPGPRPLLHEMLASRDEFRPFDVIPLSTP